MADDDVPLGVQQIGFLPASPPLTLGELQRRLVARGLTTDVVAYSVISHVKRHIPANGIGDGTRYHVWGAGAVFLAALLNENGDFNREISVLDDAGCEVLFTEVAGLTTVGRLTASTKDERHEEIGRLFLRIMSGHSSLQGDHADDAVRTLELLEAIDLTTDQLTQTTEYDELFQAEYGCTLFEYLAVLFGTWAFATNGGGLVLDASSFFSRTSTPQRFMDIGRRIFGALGCSVHEVASTVARQFPGYEVEGLVQAFFTNRPFVRIAEDKYLLPPHPFLRLLCLRGPFFKTLELAIRAAQGDPRTTQSSRLGRRFEDQVGKELNKLYAAGCLEPEHVYLRKRMDLSPDFVCFESDGSVVLVQAKLKRLSPTAFFGVSMEDFRRDAAGPIAEMVWRSIRYLFHADTAARKGILAASTEAITRRVLSSRRIFLLAVSPLMPSVFTMPQFRRMVEEGIRNKLKPDEMAWYEDNTARFAGWHVLDIRDLSRYTALLPDLPLGAGVGRYLSDVDIARRTTIPSTFQEWVRQAAGGRLYSTPRLEVWNHVFREIQQMFFLD